MSKPDEPAVRDRGTSRQPVVLAVLSLAGVLGAAAIANWDKLRGTAPAKLEPRPAPTQAVASAAPPPVQVAASAGPQSAVVSGVTGNVTVNIAPTTSPAPPPEPKVASALPRLVGTWMSEPTENPYAKGQTTRVKLRFSMFGSEVVGTVTELVGERTEGVEREMHALEGKGETVSFHTRGTLVPDDRPYKTNYRLAPDGSRLLITRSNDVATGGVTERMVASRLADAPPTR